MTGKRKTYKERILAFVLAMLIIVSGAFPTSSVTAGAAVNGQDEIVIAANEDIDVTEENTDANITPTPGETSEDTPEQSTITVNYKIVDKSGYPLKNCNVTLESLSTGNKLYSTWNGDENEPKYSISGVVPAITYKFSVEKSGYTSKSVNLIYGAESNGVTTTIVISMAEIEVDQDNLDLKVGDGKNSDKYITVKNTISETDKYIWSVDNNDNIISIEKATTVDAEGNPVERCKITANAEGNATVTVKYGEEGIPVSIPVKVSKVELNLGITVEPKEYKNKKEVTLCVVGLPWEADGKVTFYVMKNNEVIETHECDAGVTTWTYTNDKGIRGNMSFDASYSGDNKYFSVSRDAIADVAQEYTLDRELKFINDEKEKTVILEEENEFNLPVDTESVVDRELSYTSNNTEVVTVDGGKVSVVGPGKATITIKAVAGNGYTESAATYTVVVKKEIEVDKLESKAWLITEKTYDKTTESTMWVEVPAEISVEGEDDFKSLRIKFTANVEDANAGQNKNAALVNDEEIEIIGTTVNGKDIRLNEYYILKNIEKTIVKGKVNIDKRTVYLGTNDYPVDKVIHYRDNVEAIIKQEDALVKEVKITNDQTGVLEGDIIAFTEMKATINSSQDTVYDVKTHKNEIIPDMELISDTNNYHFESIHNPSTDISEYFVESELENSLGDFTVEKENINIDGIHEIVETWSAEGGVLYTKENQSADVWISDGKLVAKITDEQTKYYDQLLFSVGDAIWDLTKGGYDVSELETEVISGHLQLASSQAGRENNSTDKINFNIHIDKSAPDFIFGDWEQKTTVTDKFTQTITFNKYKNGYYSIENVSHDDTNTGDSGVDKWYYSILKTDKDVSVDYLDAYVNGRNETKICEWTEGTGKTSIPVVTGDMGTIEAVQGNYIVLVKVIDNVGNAAVYSSNGVIIDVQTPNIKFNINNDVYYNSDLDYSITVEDPNTGAASGVAKISVEVYVDGEVDTVNNPIQEINLLDTNGSYTLEEIYGSYSKREVPVTLYINKENGTRIDSNKIEIKATAYDMAGNSIAGAIVPLKIDQTKPQISVRFESDAVAQHEKYFASTRTMYITYTEKNIDKNIDSYGVTFDILAGTNIDTTSPDVGKNLSELKNYNIEYEWIRDTQADYDVKQYTDARINILKLTFAKDNEYYIVPHCKDYADNENGSVKYEVDNVITNKEFVIDTTAPIVKITYDSDNKDITNAVDSTVYGSRVDMQKQVNAYVSIEEKNFGNINEVRPEEDQISFDGSAVQKKALEATSVEALEAEALSKWGANGNSYNKTFAFLNDAAYTFAFSYKDLAGNPCTYVVGETEYVNKGKAEEELYKYVRSFTVDETKPTGTVVIDKKDSVWDTIVSAVTFNIFKNTDYTVDVTAYDATSGVKYAGYYIAKTDDYQISENTNWIEYARDAEDNYKIDENGNYVDQFNIAPNQQFVVYQKIVDHADNLQYIYPTQGAVADNASQKINLNVTANNSKENNIYNGATVEFNASFEDPIEGDTFSGIKWVYYVVTANNNGINSNDKYWYNFATEKWVTKKTERRNQVQKDEYRIFNENFTINSDTYNCNGVQVQVFAEDFAGNSFQSDPVKVDIDRTQPKIVSVTYNNVQPQNGSYYKDTREAYITIAERNFKKELISIDVKNSDGTPAAISWDVDTNGVSDGTTHTATVTFEHDGDYYFSVNGKDLAGNTMSNPLAKSDTFTIDKQDPKVSVAYDNNSAQNGNYYKAERTATITVTEHNFNGNGMTVTVNGTARSVNWYQAGGDVHKGTVTFATDGDYVFDVECTDLSGRTAANYNEDKFTVDLTNPTVEITGVADKSANKDVVSPAIRIDDTNYSANDVTITLVGAKKGSVDVGSMVSRTNSETGQILSFANFGDDMDDVYTLTAKSMDKAGNETTQSITFSVNRHGSTYAINKDTKKMLDKGYTKEPVSVIIEETNVDTLEFIELSYSKDGKIVKLTEGKDYTVKAEGGEGQWKKYTYTILASCFAEEGKYNINITSVDRAQNESNNKVQSFDVEFVVDKTAPTLAVSNLEDNMRYDTDKHQFVINVKDNTKLSKVELYIDGKLYYTYKGEELTVEDGKVYIDVESNGDEWQTIKLIAYDEADNPTEPLEYRVLVTANGWIQFVNNKPAFYGTIGGLVAAAFIIFFIIWKRKKDQEEKAA